MGGAFSSNKAKQVANVTNDIAQNTSATTVNQAYTWNNQSFNNCDITASEINIQNSSQNIIKATQVTEALQNATVVNNIAQKLAQQAQSNMGFLGIGFASASNVASEEANSTSTIKNSLASSMTNVTAVENNFTCTGSTIKLTGGLNISNSNFQEIVSDQQTKNTQIVDLSNNLSQDISQKASATVQGIAGFLIIFILIIVIIIVGAKGAKGGGGNSGGGGGGLHTLITVGVVTGVIFLLLVWMAAVHAPPFFTKPEVVFPYAYANQNGTCSNGRKATQVSTRKIHLDSAPLKYLYNICQRPNPNSSGTLASLLDLATSYIMGANDSSNNGYNQDTMKSINDNFRNSIQSQSWWSLAPTDEAFPDLMVGFESYIPKQFQDPSLAGCRVFTTTDNTKCDPTAYMKSDGTKVDADKRNCLIANPQLNQLLALSNTAGFTAYCSKSSEHAWFARFALCQYLGFQNNYYIYEGEPVAYIDDDGNNQYGFAKDINKKYLLHIVDLSLGDEKMLFAINTAVNIESQFGICPTATQAVARQFKLWGIYLFVLLLLGFLLFIILKTRRSSSSSSSRRSSPPSRQSPPPHPPHPPQSNKSKK